MKILSAALCGAAAIVVLSGCVLHEREGNRHSDRHSENDGYYDGFYGPYNSGYWASDGYFYYSDAQHNYHRDDGHHFHHEQFEGGQPFHGEHHDSDQGSGGH